MVPNLDDMGLDPASYAQVQEMDYDKPCYGPPPSCAHAEGAAASAAQLLDGLPAAAALPAAEDHARPARHVRAGADDRCNVRAG